MIRRPRSTTIPTSRPPTRIPMFNPKCVQAMKSFHIVALAAVALPRRPDAVTTCRKPPIRAARASGSRLRCSTWRSGRRSANQFSCRSTAAEGRPDRRAEIQYDISRQGASRNLLVRARRSAGIFSLTTQRVIFADRARWPMRRCVSRTLDLLGITQTRCPDDQRTP